jgi:hypothetical protein
MNFPSIRLEGAILTADLLDAIAREDKHSQKPADFGLDPSTKVKDEIASTWASAKALWIGYQAKIAALHEGQTGVSETRNLFIIPLLALLGYQPEKTEAETVNGKSYAISHRDVSRDGFPLHIMGWHDSLEKKRDTGGPRISSHALVQEYLNLTEHSYGIITNGRQLRLLRDSSRLIKLSFLEFDLNRIFEEDLYADFAILFRLIHATRMPANRANASGSVIEKYHQESVDSGSRIRDGLAAAVAFSMQTVANGLLAHSANASLVEQLKQEPARANELHQNLLRWVYRTLFVLVIEERVLHHSPTATLRQRQLYRDYYSLQRLRRLADRPQLADRRAHDLWRAMHQTLRLYEDGGKGLPLGIAPLGSFLFREEGLQQLFQYQLDNRSLLQALNRLSTFTHPDTNVRMRVNYGALDVEEFGSVYESLLELRPRIIPEGERLSFSYAQLAGNERKTTGSYYTPDSLVQCLLDSALDPIVEERLAGKTGKEAEQALLAIKVCDPAVGSGHFLIGAAHRLAQRLADIRAGEEALSPDVQRHALRDVVSRCLYGVDINPLSVELCKVSLWMLGMEPGKPLSFLDHHIRCGNSLLGATPELIRGGIPEAAYDPIEGDDKAACSALKKQNKRENPKLGEMFIADEALIRDKLFKAAAAIDDIGDSRPEDVRRKENTFAANQQNYDFRKAWDIADLWCAAFVIKKCFPESTHPVPATASVPSDTSPPAATPLPAWFGVTEQSPHPKAKGGKTPDPNPSSTPPFGITTQHLRDFVEGGELPDGLLAEARRLARQYQFFHWHLAFPEVFACGGFDVLLGNPPWEVLELDTEQWFNNRIASVASARNADERERAIQALIANPQSPGEELVVQEYLAAIRTLQSQQSFLRSSSRYRLTSVGKVNLFAVFLELGWTLVDLNGACGILIPDKFLVGDTYSDAVSFLLENRRLLSAFTFENEAKLFREITNKVTFSAVTVGGKDRNTTLPLFTGHIQLPEQLRDSNRVYSLSYQDVLRINPNSKTIPLFRDSRDAVLTGLIHSRNPVINSRLPGDAFRIRARMTAMFNMSTDSHVFTFFGSVSGKSWLVDSGWIQDTVGRRFVPVYEGKMADHFNYRCGTYCGQTQAQENKGVLPETPQEILAAPDAETQPRYLVSEAVMERATTALDWKHEWFIGFRDVGPKERTLVPCVIPRWASGHSFTLIVASSSAREQAETLGALSSFLCDYAVRQKSRRMSIFVVEQAPLPISEQFQREFVNSLNYSKFIVPRVVELNYVTHSLAAFAQDCGWSGPPFRWDEARRFLLRCELDAAFFHLYLGTEAEWSKQPEALIKAFPTPRHAVAYIMDTFPIVKRKDEARTEQKNAAGEIVKPGRYVTKDTILEIYDAFQGSILTGTPYQTRLTPPPADPRCCHPSKEDATK